MKTDGAECPEMNSQSHDVLVASTPARRHFLALCAAGAGRLSALSVAASVPAIFKTKAPNALGIFPRGYPNRGPDHNCFGRGTLIRDGELPVEDLTLGSLVMTLVRSDRGPSEFNCSLRVKASLGKTKSS